MAFRGVRLAVGLAVVVVIAGAGYWAGLNAIVPPSLAETPGAPQTYLVAEGSVGHTVRLGARAWWPRVLEVLTPADGVVTTIPYDGGPAMPGDVVVTVNLSPVVVATGQVPMFRDLALDAEGPDVMQFQNLLGALGYLEANSNLGTFDRATQQATRRWQREMGHATTGTVTQGTLLFVPQLPARLEVLVAVGDSVTRGSTPLVAVVASEPSFVGAATLSQALEVRSGMSVDIVSPVGGSWTGTLGEFREDGDGRVSIVIDGVDCGECESVGLTGETTMSATVVLVPPTTGPVVPVAALVQMPSGGLAVRLADGGHQAVEVVAEANGFAVVDGVELGTSILLSAPVGR